MSDTESIQGPGGYWIEIFEAARLPEALEEHLAESNKGRSSHPSDFMIEIALIVGVVAVWFGFNYYSCREDWKALADELGLSFDWGGPFNRGGMSGAYGGVFVKMRVSRQYGMGANLFSGFDPSGKSRHPKSRGNTTYKVSFDRVGAGLAITEQGTAAKLGKLLGAQDVEIGVASLDDAFVIKADDPALAREILRRDGIENVLLELRYKTTSFKLADGVLRLKFDKSHVGYEVSAYIAKLTNLMKMLAEQAPAKRALESSAGSPDDVDTVDRVDEVPAEWW